MLRLATAADRPALLDLWVAAWTAAAPAIDFKARRQWFDERLDALSRMGSVTILAYEGADALAGFVTLDVAAHYLDQLAVAPDRRGSGLAKHLLGEAKRRAGPRLSLHVNQDNARAVRFYRREGFSVVSAGVNPRSGLPVWLMEWERGRHERQVPDPSAPIFDGPHGLG